MTAPGGKSPPMAEGAVRKAVCDFFLDLNQGRFRSAYDSMSVAYKMRVERKAFFEKHPALRNVAMISQFGQPEFRSMKIRKLTKDNVHECDCVSEDKSKGKITFVSTTLRLVQEDGAIKIDDFAEIKATQP